MTADTATEAPAADTAEAAALDVLGPQRAAALSKYREAADLAAEADVMLLRADLADAAAKILGDLEQKEAATAAAREALTEPLATLAGLEAELAECQRRAGNIATVIGDDMDMAARVEARSLRLAFAEEGEHLAAKVTDYRNTAVAPLQAGLRAAEDGETLARQLASYVVEADADPLHHELGRAMPSYALRMARRWGETIITGNAKDPEYAEAIQWLKTALRTSGVGEQVQVDAIQAWLAGDPVARSVNPGTKTWPDGTKLIASPDGPPVVTRRASPAELRALPGKPLPDSTPASAVIAQQWASAGAQHQQRPGLPGAHFPTEQALPGAGGALTK
jgi:tetratricopeptide (TPR) repeat protein